LQAVENDKSKAYCRLCKTKFDIGNMGISSISSHEKGKKHNLLSVVGQPEGKQSILQFPRRSITTENRMLSTSKAASDVEISTELESTANEADSSKPHPAATETTQPMTTKNSIFTKYLLKDQVVRAEII
jgi:hypothetical protein